MAHFEGCPAVLIQLDKIGRRALKVAIEDAWLACAPSKLADQYTSAGPAAPVHLSKASPPLTLKGPWTGRPQRCEVFAHAGDELDAS